MFLACKQGSFNQVYYTIEQNFFFSCSFLLSLAIFLVGTSWLELDFFDMKSSSRKKKVLGWKQVKAGGATIFLVHPSLVGTARSLPSTLYSRPFSGLWLNAWKFQSQFGKYFSCQETTRKLCLGVRHTPERETEMAAIFVVYLTTSLHRKECRWLNQKKDQAWIFDAERNLHRVWISMQKVSCFFGRNNLRLNVNVFPTLWYLVYFAKEASCPHCQKTFSRP